MAKARKKKSKKAKKTIKRVQGKDGRGVIQEWVFLFQENAKKHQPDSAISKALKKNFPGRNSAIFDAVQAVRNRYNKGILTKGKAPATLSVRYDEDGNVCTARGATKKIAKKKKAKKS